MKYSEASYYGKREFILEPPYIHAKGKQTPNGTEYDCKVELLSLNPEYTTLRLRNPYLIFAILVMAVGFFGAVFAGEKMLSGFGANLFWCAVSFFIVGLICVVFTIPKLQAVSFQSKAGVAMLLFIRAGSQKDVFMQFVAAVQQAIREAESGPRD